MTEGGSEALTRHRFKKKRFLGPDFGTTNTNHAKNYHKKNSGGTF